MRLPCNSGFDAIVGNPPFAGKNTTINAHASGYQDWLKVVNPESHGNADLVAHFFRRAFSLLRQSGCFGLIATNTIAQGDTRSTGLRYICEQGGTIYNAQKRMKWPGLAAVVVSVIHVFKGQYENTKLLDGREVNLISAFLFHAGGNENPKVLLVNADKSFQGSILLGMGFTFDDSNTDATTIAEMHRLIEQNPKNAERIFPYIGGEEVNSSPTHTHHRYVINFGEISEAEARQYPDLIKIVEEKVKPARLAQNREIRARYWWRFGETTPALFKAITPLNRVLVTNCGATPHLSLTFLPSNMVFANTLAILAFQNHGIFAILQSRIHEIWARFFSSSMKDDLRYTPSDCFQTFPFPENWETNAALEEVGKTYYEYRAALMVRNNQGLTDTYNRKKHADGKPACVFKGNNPLPIVAVDEQIYRRLPCFIISTVDKFANLPWVGQTGALFGKVTHFDEKVGFTGPADAKTKGRALDKNLPPPDLIIQDELHLISGPLGTMVGLYETVIDVLCSVTHNDKTIRPKIIASTATVRRAERQIQALFSHSQVDIFPPPGPDRHDSFFAETVPITKTPGRLYVGVVAQGRSLKVVLLRAYLALLGAAKQAWEDAGGKTNQHNPADP